MATDAREAMGDDVAGPAAADPRPTATTSIDDAFSSLLQPLKQLIERIVQRLDRLDGGVSPADLGPSLSHAIDELRTEQISMSQKLAELGQRFDQVVEDVSSAADLPPARNKEDVELQVADGQTTASAAGDWEIAILGPQLCADESVSQSRRKLLDETLAGDPEALGLVARIMLVQSAQSDELPLLLKDLGDAFYQWRSKATSNEPFEQVLVDWLNDHITALGLWNRIEIVHAGDRYDSSRHLSSQRGREISEVHGWIVLRENGRPLSKANVSLRQD